MIVSQEVMAMSYPIDLPAPAGFDFYLTWPAATQHVSTVQTQWRKLENGDIESWYTRAELSAALASMQDAIDNSNNPIPELRRQDEDSS